MNVCQCEISSVDAEPLLTLCCPPQAALKKYQMEHKSKGESLEKCQAELKKLRRKSQSSKHPSKYGDKEMQVSVFLPKPGLSSGVCRMVSHGFRIKIQKMWLGQLQASRKAAVQNIFSSFSPSLLKVRVTIPNRRDRQ